MGCQSNLIVKPGAVSNDVNTVVFADSHKLRGLLTRYPWMECKDGFEVQFYT